ncbi:hypothetical protein DEO72_LG6g3382 [Vigna unguiculata]|uniref:Uncharacterized protein n=1 Tax=Vigna unguiculata TaxID=3917 RepID=A0A4D6MD08_VIGUN|nr:hypothetical protein DEO72_LG6g3382 [Vigna unguiculata]
MSSLQLLQLTRHAVSYTQLDVYKRQEEKLQPIDFFIRERIIHQIFKAAKSIKDNMA